MVVPTASITLLLPYVLPVLTLHLLPLVGFPQHRNQSIPKSLTASIHDVRCLESPSRTKEIDPAACDSIIDTICDSISAPDPYRGKWIWATVPGCALGYYMTSWGRSSRLPTISQCKDRVFRPMIRSCAALPPRERAVMNVKILPDNTHIGTAVRE